MTKELGVGIIGCGNISTTYFSLSPLFKGLKVLACADINMEAAEARAAEYGVKAQTAPSALYDYYNPEARVALAPSRVVVR